MHPDTLRRALDYIDSNLRTDITPEAVAAYAGYSTYHFCRLFAAQMGRPISAYVLRRRLQSALYEIANGYKAIDVVLEHGFDTYAGFYKAFVREYGCSPKKYVAIYGIPSHKSIQAEERTMRITRKQIKDLLQSWDIDPALPVHDVLYGNGARVAEDVWRIGEEYFLRHRVGRTSQLKSIAISKALHAQGLGAPLPVPTRTGEAYVDGGDTLTILTRRVKGTPYELLDPFSPKAQRYASACGRAIAKLHRALLALEGEVTVDTTDIFRTVSEWALPDVRKQNQQWALGLPDSFFEDFTRVFGGLQADLPRQTIHRDPNPGNILLEGDTVSGFLDFDLSERNVRLFDPCYCATGVLSGAETDEQYARWLAIVHAILRAYDAESPLTAQEKQAVYYVICAIQMICVAYFNGIHDPDFKSLTQTNRKMLQFVAGHKAEIDAIFLC